MDLSFDERKRAITLRERGLDLADAARVFATEIRTRRDLRFDYGEHRFITAGYMDGRLVVLVWTSRGEARHIISIRHAHAREARRWHAASA